MDEAEAKRLLILTGDGLEHHYVANVLSAALPITAIVVAQEPQRRNLPAGLRSRFFFVIPRIIRMFYWQAVRDAQQRRSSFVRILGEGLTADFQRGDLVRRVQGINSEQTRELLTKL